MGGQIPPVGDPWGVRYPLLETCTGVFGFAISSIPVAHIHISGAVVFAIDSIAPYCTYLSAGLTAGAEESEEALEAELLALQGKSPAKGKGKSPKSSKVMSMKEIDVMMAGLEGVGEDEVCVCLVWVVSVCVVSVCVFIQDEDDDEGAWLNDGEDDSELLAELREIAAGADSEEEEATPTAPPSRHHGNASTPSKPSTEVLYQTSPPPSRLLLMRSPLPGCC